MILLIPQEAPLAEFNHAHDRMGRFSSGGAGSMQHQAPDTGSGGGGITANPNSIWHGKDRTVAHLKDRHLFYKNISRLNSDRTPEGAELGGAARQHLADIEHALAAKQTARAAKAAARAAAAPAGPAMHNGTMLTPSYMTTLDVSSLARIASQDWRKSGKGVNYAAKPYLDTLHSMSSINDNYGQDSGHSIAAYFLGNATSWKGPVAKAVKAEINRRLKGGKTSTAKAEADWANRY